MPSWYLNRRFVSRFQIVANKTSRRTSASFSGITLARADTLARLSASCSAAVYGPGGCRRSERTLASGQWRRCGREAVRR